MSEPKSEISRLAKFITDGKVIVSIVFALILGIFYAGYQANTYFRALGPLIDPDAQIFVDVSFSEQSSASATTARSNDNIEGLMPWNAASCPSGYVLTGLQGFGAPGSIRYCVGCAMGVRLICQRLSAQVVR